MNTYEKLRKEIFLSKKRNSNYYLLCNKILKKYIINCLILRRKQFTLKFKGKYDSNFLKRFKENVKYYFDILYYRIHKVSMKNSKYYHPFRPIHLKLLGNVDEQLLEYILDKTDLVIKKELLYLNDTKYVIGIK